MLGSYLELEFTLWLMAHRDRTTAPPSPSRRVGSTRFSKREIRWVKGIRNLIFAKTQIPCWPSKFSAPSIFLSARHTSSHISQTKQLLTLAL